jgi:hypothetical protein
MKSAPQESSMETDSATCKSRDILSSPLGAFAVFCLPAAAMLVAGNSWFTNGWRTVAWTVALSTMGMACIVNAARCGRVHCYLTGPFFLLMAFVTLLYGRGVVPLGQHGWSVIGATVLAGAILLCCVPEKLFGRYRNGHGANREDD